MYVSRNTYLVTQKRCGRSRIERELKEVGPLPDEEVRDVERRLVRCRGLQGHQAFGVGRLERPRAQLDEEPDQVQRWLSIQQQQVQRKPTLVVLDLQRPRMGLDEELGNGQR